jgi:dienelactone hydrolase
MRLNSVIAALALLIASTASALALESTLTVLSPLSPNDLWQKVGDFCGMTAWHPLVQTCFLSDDGKQRTVVFFGGIGKAVGTLDNWDDANRSYTFTNVWTFTNVSGLMPIANYHATVSVTENANGASLNMTATYDASGAADADAKRAVDQPIHLSLCFNGPLLCSRDRGSVAPAALVHFNGIPASPKPLISQGYLRRPEGAGPFPAVVLLHGCDGSPEAIDQNWGVTVSSWGYVTLAIDSFGPRGIKNTCADVKPPDLFSDAYRGLNFLVQQQFVDAKRVAVVGFSQGGWLTLWSAERGGIEQYSENKFRAAVAFYPPCRAFTGVMAIPTLILIGERDDWTTADACRKLAAGEDEQGNSRHKSDGAAIQLIVYPNAYHAFDLSSLETPVTYFGHHIEFNKSATDQSRAALREFLETRMTH